MTQREMPPRARPQSDGWPVRRLKLIALINTMQVSDAAKVIATIWIEASYEGRILQMSVRELTRRRGRRKRQNTSRAIGELERALASRGWLVIQRPRTSREFSGELRTSWPILAAYRADELQAAYDAAILDRRGALDPVPDLGQGSVPDLGAEGPRFGTGDAPDLGRDSPEVGHRSPSRINGAGETRENGRRSIDGAVRRLLEARG